MPSIDNLKKLDIKKSYDSDKDDLLNDFYIPVMSAGVIYKRLAGFFSSGILSAAASGIAEFIENGGRMQLIVGSQLQEDDYAIIKKSEVERKKYIEGYFKKEFNNLEDFIRNEKLEAMAWMLANDKMDLKIGFVPQGGLFHLKVGIVKDRYGNSISFSGSDNETPSAWKHNVEEFKVFKNWDNGQFDYYESDEEKFDRFWSGNGSKACVVDLPEAIREKIIKSVPKFKKDLKLFKKRKLEHSKKGDAKSGRGTVQLATKNSKIQSIKLRSSQKEALDFWSSHNDSALLAMATGAGKTITALFASYNIFKKYKECLTIIVVPQLYLATQWVEEDVREMFPEALIIEAHSNSPEWRAKMKEALSDYSDGFNKQIFIVTLYSTMSSDDFLTIFNNKYRDNRTYMIIADEVHNFGASRYSRGMIDGIRIRLGLSATPTRYFDEEGTDLITSYFGKTYEYAISNAIEDKILVPYDYYPIFVEMTEDEFEEYSELCKKISRSSFMKDGENNNQYLEHLFLERSRIVKKCENKLPALSKILVELKSQGKANKMLIYCDSIEQVLQTEDILSELDLKCHKITQNESMTDRKAIIKSFIEGNYDILVAVKILDEGVNIPSVQTAIIQASSTNPREYIQRRGRVLRRSPNKDKAYIYDFIVLPPADLLNMDGNMKKIEQNILKREINRVQDFYNTANNKTYVMNKIIDKLIKYDVYLD